MVTEGLETLVMGNAGLIGVLGEGQQGFRPAILSPFKTMRGGLNRSLDVCCRPSSSSRTPIMRDWRGRVCPTRVGRREKWEICKEELRW
jgi:hypothetical protein